MKDKWSSVLRVGNEDNQWSY